MPSFRTECNLLNIIMSGSVACFCCCAKVGECLEARNEKMVTEILVVFSSNHGEVCRLPVISPSIATLQSTCKDIASMEVGLGYIASEENAKMWFARLPIFVMLEFTSHKESTVVLRAQCLRPRHIAFVRSTNLNEVKEQTRC